MYSETLLRSVPATPDPNTSAKVSRYKWEPFIVIQIGGVYTTFCQEEAYFCRSIAIQMGGVSQYFSKVSGSGVDLTLLICFYLELRFFLGNGGEEGKT